MLACWRATLTGCLVPAFLGVWPARCRSTLRSGIMAGSICPIELMRRAEKEMSIKRMTICYGMTETSPVSVATHYTGERRRVG